MPFLSFNFFPPTTRQRKSRDDNMALPKKTALSNNNPTKTTASKASPAKKKITTQISVTATLTATKRAASPPAITPVFKRQRKAAPVEGSSSEDAPTKKSTVKKTSAKKTSVKKAAVKKIPVKKSPIKKVTTKNVSVGDSSSAKSHDEESQNEGIITEETAAQDQLLKDTAVGSFTSYGWTTVNDPKPKLTGDMESEEYDIEESELTEDEYSEPLDPDRRPVRQLIDNLEAGPEHLKLVHYWLRLNASPGTVKDYFTPFHELINQLGFESPALTLHEMSALRVRTIAVIKAEGKKLEDQKCFTILKNGTVKYASWTDRWLEDSWNGSTTKPARSAKTSKSASAAQLKTSNEDSPQIDKEFPLQCFLEHGNTSFTPGQCKVICVWMMKNSVVTNPGEVPGLVGELYDKLGFGASEFDQDAQRRMKAKFRSHMILQAKKFKDNRAIIESESKPGTMEYAAWTKHWLNKNWDGSITEPEDAETEEESDVETLDNLNEEQGPCDNEPLIAESPKSGDGGAVEKGQPQQEDVDDSSEGEEVSEEEYALVRDARQKEFFKGEKWQTTTSSLQISTPCTSTRRAAGKPAVNEVSGAEKGSQHVGGDNDVEMANSSSKHTTPDVTDNTNKISTTPDRPMMAPEITTGNDPTLGIDEPLIKQSKTMKEIQMKTTAGEMSLPASNQGS